MKVFDTLDELLDKKEVCKQGWNLIDRYGLRGAYDICKRGDWILRYAEKIEMNRNLIDEAYRQVYNIIPKYIKVSDTNVNRVVLDAADDISFYYYNKNNSYTEASDMRNKYLHEMADVCKGVFGNQVVEHTNRLLKNKI